MLTSSRSSGKWAGTVDTSFQSLKQIYSQIQSNAFGMTSGAGRVVGQGLFLAAAMMNHSCNPNCRADDVSAAMITVRTIVDVEPGEELTTSYTDISKAVTSRRKVLRQQYNFDCQCERCVSDLGANKSNGVHPAIGRFAASDLELGWDSLADVTANSTTGGASGGNGSGGSGGDGSGGGGGDGGSGGGGGADAATLSLKSKVKRMKPKELKAGLKSLSMSTQGSKKDLIARLFDALASSSGGNGESSI